jgi:hypothetical protein
MFVIRSPVDVDDVARDLFHGDTPSSRRPAAAGLRLYVKPPAQWGGCLIPSQNGREYIVLAWVFAEGRQRTSGSIGRNDTGTKGTDRGQGDESKDAAAQRRRAGDCNAQTADWKRPVRSWAKSTRMRSLVLDAI